MGFVFHPHLVADPLGMVPFVLLVLETPVLQNVCLGFAMGNILAMWAWIQWVVRATAVSMSAMTIVVATTTSTAFSTLSAMASFPRFFIGGVAVGLYSSGRFTYLVIGINVLLLEELGELGNVVCDCVGVARRSGCSDEALDSICPSKFFEHAGDAGGVMYMIVGVLVADGL